MSLLAVAPIPETEDPTEREARTAAMHVFAALAVGGTLTKAAYDTKLRWPWLNMLAVLAVGMTASAAGFGVGRLVDRVAKGPLASSRGRIRFWSRYITVFFVDAIAFNAMSQKLEGWSLWRGTSRWATTVGWPLAALMLVANGIDVEAGDRVTAVRNMLLSPLAALRNRRALDADLPSLLREHVGFVYVFGDLDHFKSLNDRLGHDVGDQAIRHFAKAIDESHCVAYHRGGDEFVLLFPLAQRGAITGVLRDVSIRLRTFGEQVGHNLTASFGATSVSPGDARAAEAIGAAADQVMYAAKKAGGDRFVLDDDGPITLGPN